MRYLPPFCLGMIGAFLLPEPISYFKIVLCVFLILTCFLAFLYTPFRYLVFFLLGVAYALLRIDIAIGSQVDDRLDPLDKVSLQIEVVDITAHQPRQKQRFLVKVLNPDLPFRRIMLSDFQARDWPLGSRWQIEARLRSSIGRINDAGLNSESLALSQGVDGFATVKKVQHGLNNQYAWLYSPSYFLKSIRSHKIKRLDSYRSQYPGGSALVESLALGYRENLPKLVWQDFRKLGLSHLMSISGLHVGIVAFLLALLCLWPIRFLANTRYYRFLPKNPLILVSVIGFIGAGFYALLSGFSVSVQRSMLMLAVILYCILSRKYFSSWQIWWLALGIVLIFDPTSILSVGFWLSFLLVASLLLLSYKSYSNRYKSYMMNLLRAEYATTIVSILLIAVFFYVIPIHSFLANLITIPWFSLLITPLCLLSLFLPFDFLLKFSVILSEYSLQALHLLSSNASILVMPKLPLALLILCAIASIFLIVPKGFGFKIWSVTMFLALFLYEPSKIRQNDAKITVLDVGQGLSVLVQTREHQLLYDTGKQYVQNDLVSNLYAKGITSLDMLVLSHHDNDHDGAWRELLEIMPITHIMAGQPEHYGNSLTQVDFCEKGLTWDWDGVHFEMLTVYRQQDKVSKNNRSCVLRIVAENDAVLIMGDLSIGGEQELVRRYGDGLYSTVLILGHHGSKTSSSDVFLETVAPSVAIASSGYKNSFHHPSSVILDRVREKDIFLLRTDYQGAIEINMSDNLLVRPVVRYKPYWQKKPIDLKYKIE